MIEFATSTQQCGISESLIARVFLLIAMCHSNKSSKGQ